MHPVILVRHAEAVWSADDTGPLTEHGRADAARVADRLADVGIAAIYSSPYPRTLQTIAPLAARLGLSVQEVDDLRERRLGDGEFPDFVAAVRATWDDFAFSHPGGESNGAAQRRVVHAFDELRRCCPTGRIALSTHGNALALLLKHFDASIGFDFWKAMSRPDIYRLDWYDDGNMKIDCLW